MPLSVMPNTTALIPACNTGRLLAVPVGMENPYTHTLEAIQIGAIVEGVAHYSWLTGSLIRDDGTFAVAGRQLFELTPSLKGRATRFLRERAKRHAQPNCPVPPTPKGMGHSEWLAMCNCD